ncbi:MAG: hypothetical protein WAX89_00715 [Alphaproteobacteria bacterium]
MVRAFALLLACASLTGCTEAMHHSFNTTINDIKAYNPQALRPLVEPPEGYPINHPAYRQNYCQHRGGANCSTAPRSLTHPWGK